MRFHPVNGRWKRINLLISSSERSRAITAEMNRPIPMMQTAHWSWRKSSLAVIRPSGVPTRSKINVNTFPFADIAPVCHSLSQQNTRKRRRNLPGWKVFHFHLLAFELIFFLFFLLSNSEWWRWVTTLAVDGSFHWSKFKIEIESLETNGINGMQSVFFSAKDVRRWFECDFRTHKVNGRGDVDKWKMAGVLRENRLPVFV